MGLKMASDKIKKQNNSSSSRVKWKIRIQRNSENPT